MLSYSPFLSCYVLIFKIENRSLVICR